MAPARFSSVDFPQPLRPTSATSSPGAIASETPSSARTFCPSLTYSLTTFRSSTSAIGEFSVHLQYYAESSVAANARFHTAKMTREACTGRKTSREDSGIERARALVYTPHVVFRCSATATARDKCSRAVSQGNSLFKGGLNGLRWSHWLTG